MKQSLKTRLILSYLAIALITVLVVVTVIRLTSGQSLMNLVVEEQTLVISESLKTYYSEKGSLEGFHEYYSQQSRGQGEGSNNSPGAPGQGREYKNLRGVEGVFDPTFHALLPTLGFDVGEVVPEDLLKQAVAVEVDGAIIAWILPDTQFQFTLSAEEEVFLKRTMLAAGFSALAGVLLAVGMGFLLAGGLLKPIRRLTKASKALAHGELGEQVPVTSLDELGTLTTTFNQMSADLLKADQQRKRLTADITHDLGTPLQIISGYMEMLEDGKVTLTPQRVEIIRTEVEHLRRLVSDLGTLTQVEAGGLDIQPSPVQPRRLLEQVYQAFQPITNRQGVELVLNVPDALPDIRVDEGRMLQVLKNLVENALRYTPTGGRITLGAQGIDVVRLSVADTGSGIDPEDLPYIFERFYRADKTRGGSSGKMGLGLAICKALVSAQGGVISVESGGKDEGTTFVMTFEGAKIDQDKHV